MKVYILSHHGETVGSSYIVGATLDVSGLRPMIERYADEQGYSPVGVYVPRAIYRLHAGVAALEKRIELDDYANGGLVLEAVEMS